MLLLLHECLLLLHLHERQPFLPIRRRCAEVSRCQARPMQVRQASTTKLLHVRPLRAQRDPLGLLLHLLWWGCCWRRARLRRTNNNKRSGIQRGKFNTVCMVDSTHPKLLRLLRHACLLHGSIGILLWPPDGPPDRREVLGVHGEFTLPTTPAKLQRVGSRVHATNAQPVGWLLQAEAGRHRWSLQHAKVACGDASAYLCCSCVAKAIDCKTWMSWQTSRGLLPVLCVEGQP